ncbi:hypothetical protein HF521_005014, partial [Silurus meridionalis]
MISSRNKESEIFMVSADETRLLHSTQLCVLLRSLPHSDTHHQHPCTKTSCTVSVHACSRGTFTVVTNVLQELELRRRYAERVSNHATLTRPCSDIQHNHSPAPDREAEPTGPEHLSLQLDPGLPDRETSVSPDWEQHLQHHHTEHWGPSGLCAQSTAVHSADSRLCSNAQLESYHQHCGRPHTPITHILHPHTIRKTVAKHSGRHNKT